MHALRIFKTISTDRVPELMEFEGKRVEIIILPDFADDIDENNNENVLDLRGILSQKIDGMEFQSSVRKEWNMR